MADTLTATFRVNVEPDPAGSKEKGRPVFREMEVVDIRFPGRRDFYTFPAHDADPVATRAAIDAGEMGSGEVVTYAMSYNAQYKQFKSREQQSVAGTPLAELPFLTESRRRELRALNIQTAEQLSALDGVPLRQLGPGGREMKDQATAYLKAAEGSADVTALAAENATLRVRMDEMQKLMESYASRPAKGKFQKSMERLVAQETEEPAEPEVTRIYLDEPAEVTPTEEEPSTDPEAMTAADLKAFIRERTGETVKGNPSHDTLVKRAREV